MTSFATGMDDRTGLADPLLLLLEVAAAAVVAINAIATLVWLHITGSLLREASPLAVGLLYLGAVHAIALLALAGYELKRKRNASSTILYAALSLHLSSLCALLLAVMAAGSLPLLIYALPVTVSAITLTLAAILYIRASHVIAIHQHETPTAPLRETF